MAIKAGVEELLPEELNREEKANINEILSLLSGLL